MNDTRNIRTKVYEDFQVGQLDEEMQQQKNNEKDKTRTGARLLSRLCK